jgi:hypothetical protein
MKYILIILIIAGCAKSTTRVHRDTEKEFKTPLDRDCQYNCKEESPGIVRCTPTCTRRIK